MIRQAERRRSTEFTALRYRMLERSELDASVWAERRKILLGLTVTPFLKTAAGAAMPSPSSQSGGASTRLPIIVFDVNETILDFNVIAPVFVRIFDDSRALREWFNYVILYSEALTLAGEYLDSGAVGVAVLNMLAAIRGRKVEASDIDEIKRLSANMPTYTDTPAALTALREAGFQLVTLSNNPTAAVEAQLGRAGLRPFFDHLYSIDDEVHRYKPARESYVWLAGKLGVTPSDLWLVSCHAFDTLGAASAGCRTALILRSENAPVALGKKPEIVGSDLREVASRIVQLSGPR